MVSQIPQKTNEKDEEQQKTYAQRQNVLLVDTGRDDTGVGDHLNVLGDRRGDDDLLRVGPRIGDDLREANVLPGGYSTGVDDDLEVVLLDVGHDGTVLSWIRRLEGHDDT